MIIVVEPARRDRYDERILLGRALCMATGGKPFRVRVVPTAHGDRHTSLVAVSACYETLFRMYVTMPELRTLKQAVCPYGYISLGSSYPDFLPPRLDQCPYWNAEQISRRLVALFWERGREKALAEDHSGIMHDWRHQQAHECLLRRNAALGDELTLPSPRDLQELLVIAIQGYNSLLLSA